MLRQHVRTYAYARMSNNYACMHTMYYNIRDDDNNSRREWLEYDSDKDQMHCKTAIGESQKRGPFVLGTQFHTDV